MTVDRCTSQAVVTSPFPQVGRVPFPHETQIPNRLVSSLGVLRLFFDFDELSFDSRSVEWHRGNTEDVSFSSSQL